jgi:hypothetical protein
MTYQDQWVKGQREGKGYRECAERYGFIKAFCERFEGPFTVCDIGANMCYFGLRLTEDFPQCTVMAFEFDHFEMRQAHLKKNNADRILLFNRKLSLDDAVNLGKCCHFDVVLALSVMHHFVGSFDAWLAALHRLGGSLIAEFATDDSAVVNPPTGYRIPQEVTVLGYGASHLKRDVQRPILLVQK